MSHPADHEPVPASGTPEPERGSGRPVWRALRFPFTLRRRLRSLEKRLDHAERELPLRLEGLERALNANDAALALLQSGLRDLGARLGNRLDLLGDQLAQRQTVAEQRLDLSEAAQRALQGEVERLRDQRTPAVEGRLDDLEDTARGAASDLARLRDQALPAAVSRGDVLVERLAEQLEEVASLVERMLRSEPLPLPLSPAVEGQLAAGLAATGRVLAAFRGDEAEIRHRLERYLPALRVAEPVLDLGCGRGELLLLLREAGVPARGVEADPALAEAARRRGLDVVEGDVLDALQGLADRSWGAVTAIHLLEHLPPALLLATLSEVRRVLRPGGLLVAECPNPHCLRVGASLYWRDPTHQHPLLPETLELFLKAGGYTVESVTFLHPFPADQRFAPPSPLEPPAADSPTAALAAEVLSLQQRLDELLSGPRDFVLLARRPDRQEDQ